MKNFPNHFNELQSAIKGDLYTDRISKTMLSTDASIFQIEPAGVVYPKSAHDVISVVEFASAYGLSVHPRGAGSGLCGGAIGKGLIVDFTKYMNRFISFDPETKTVECEPGFRGGELNGVLESTNLFFPPDPSSFEYATFGGMTGTNASGSHSVKYGNVSDYLDDADVVLSSGKVLTLSDIQSLAISDLPENLRKFADLIITHEDTIRLSYPNTPCNTTGYNLRNRVDGDRLDLKGLFAGSEGTLGIMTRLKFRLLTKPRYDSLVVAFMDDVVSSARAVQQILPMGPSGIEIMDKSLLRLASSHDPRLAKTIPKDMDNVLLIEFDAFDADECASLADAAYELLHREGFTTRAYKAVSKDEKARFWQIRKAAVPILFKLKGSRKILALIEDAVVPIHHLVDYFKGLYRILNRHSVRFVIYGHIAKGLLHTRPLLDLKEAHDIRLLRTLADDVFELVSSLNGCISGEHGDGRLRSAYIPRQYPKLFPLFLTTKQLLDPHQVLNPDIITHTDPDQMKKWLRYGDAYRRVNADEPILSWDSNFEDEIEKCHGCSKCTTVTPTTRMCPVYKIVREEAASPKAKANLMRAWLSGKLEPDFIDSPELDRISDLCIHCGSCYLECPSNVNIPKMILEVRLRYLQRYGSSLSDRMLTNPDVLGKIFHPFTDVIKPVSRLPMVRKISRQFAGIASERPMIPFSRNSLFERIPTRSGNGKSTIIYFSGCYSAYFRPEIGLAAIKLLKHLDAAVYVPEQVCCGLPMLSKGMIRDARRKIEQNIRLWGELAQTSTAIVVTCSSCALSLMQTWREVLDTNTVAMIQKKVIPISRFLMDHRDHFNFRPSNSSVFYHSPCHMRVLPDAGMSQQLLSSINGIRVHAPNTGCCGMAGTWGLQAKHYELSLDMGQGLMNTISDSRSAYVATDCPTCQMQIEHCTGLPVRHPVEIAEV